MSKRETVFFALPIDQMNGKMATKQLNIQYAGQAKDETAYNLAIGRHMATNFKKYVVLTKVRGKNRFYVKSRVTVNNTIYNRTSQALLALVSSLATQLDLACKARPEQRPYAGILKSYDEMAEEGMTLRDYLTSILLTQVRSNEATLVAPYAPVPGQAPESETIGDNPFAALNITYNSSGVTTSYTKSDAQKKVMQKYFEGMQGVNNTTWREVTIVNKNLKKYTIKLPTMGAGVDWSTLSLYVAGHAYDLQISMLEPANHMEMTLYDGRGRTIASGAIYSDEARTTNITSSDEVDTVTTIYFG